MENLLTKPSVIKKLAKGPDEINLMFVFGWIIDNDSVYADNLTGVNL